MVTNPDAGVVMDGSNCGTGKVCVQGICSPLVQVAPPAHCPSNNLAYQCSGHGVEFLYLKNRYFLLVLNINIVI